MINIITNTYEIYEGQGKLKVLVKDWYLASRMHRVFRYYPADTTFTNGDEPVFIFNIGDLDLVLDVISVSSIQRSSLSSTIKQQRSISDSRRG